MTQYSRWPSVGFGTWKSPVPTSADLPVLSNSIGDARIAEDVGFVFVWNGSSWINNGGSGTVTSIALSADPMFTVSGSPITGAGTLNLGLTAEPANTVLTGPVSGPSATPSFKLAGNISTSTTGVIVVNGAHSTVGPGVTIDVQNSDTTHTGLLTATDWNTFNNKLDKAGFNYITNPDSELNVVGWNLYNNAGRAVQALVVVNDITYTAVALGDSGNGINIDYVFHATQPASAPLITVVSSTHITAAWYNGPTLANNPTATQLKAAWDAVPGAVAIATAVITGSASTLQYITGAHLTANGGDTSPIDGTGGIVAGVTLTINTVTPLIGASSFDLGKDAANREGSGVSTDFFINTIDEGQQLEISFVYQSSSGMVLGTASDVRVFVYDITNASLIPVTPLYTVAGPVNTPKTFVGQFKASPSKINYRLIFHIATNSAVAWDFLFDSVVVTDILPPATPTQVPSVVLKNQAISGAVTDHMAVGWIDGATRWVPATSIYNGDYWGMFGFATNILGGTADIFVDGYMDGFSFGPFVGYNQYVDPASAGGLTPLPSPFTDTYLIMGKAVSATAINIQVYKGIDLVPTKGGLLTNSGANNGTGDRVLSVAADGNALIANASAALGINWAPAIVAAAPFTYTTSTRTLTVATATNAVSGIMSAADHATLHAAVTIGTANGLSVAGQALSLAAATNAVPGALTAADHTTFAGYAATIALKAPIAAPVFTGDVSVSTGNLLIGTLGKGLQVKTGVNSRIGTVALVAGSATVANTSVTANSRIFLTSQTDGGTLGFLRITAKTIGTSFVITSSNPLDTSTVAWMIVESIP